MITHQITSTHDPLWSEIVQTYTAAFPSVERRDIPLLVDLLDGKSGFCSFAFSDEGVYIGFMHFWEFPSFIYLEHFAIAPEARQKGYGGGAIRWLLDRVADTPLLLEVELPIDDDTRRRISFYERHGLHLLDTPYLQPPYRETDEELPLRLMCTKGQLPDDAVHTLRTKVYGCSE